MNQQNQRLNAFLSLFVLGMTSQVMQAWLVRESLVVFYGNELSLGAVFGSWLTWIALGSLAVIWLRERRWVKEPTRGLSFILLSLPLLMALEVVAVRAIRRLLDTPSVELVPLGELFPSVALLTLPIAMALGLAFPLACKALSESDAKSIVRGISWLYVAEAAGAGLEDVVKTTVFLKDMNDFGAMNSVYAEYFPNTPPARAAVQVAALPKDVDIEIEAIVLIPG